MNQKSTKFLLNLKSDDKTQPPYAPFFPEEAEQFDTHVTGAHPRVNPTSEMGMSLQPTEVVFIGLSPSKCSFHPLTIQSNPLWLAVLLPSISSDQMIQLVAEVVHWSFPTWDVLYGRCVTGKEVQWTEPVHEPELIKQKRVSSHPSQEVSQSLSNHSSIIKSHLSG